MVAGKWTKTDNSIFYGEPIKQGCLLVGTLETTENGQTVKGALLEIDRETMPGCIVIPADQLQPLIEYLQAIVEGA